jgi:hypothetical protein
MQVAHRDRDASRRDCGVMFYCTEATYAALSARAAEEERTLSTTVARIVRDGLKTSETAAGKGGFAKSVTALNGSD